MNSARIALVGVTSEHFGRGAAEGFLHDFEGWAIFMICIACLIGEMALLARLSHRRLRDVFGIHLPGAAPAPAAAETRVRAVPRTLGVAVALLAGVAAAQTLAPLPESVLPARRPFDDFPLRLPGWQGIPVRMDPAYLEILKPDDYLLANYTRSAAPQPINLYVAYYAAQRHGLAAHSPSECLPADGWEMQSFERHLVEGARTPDGPLEVNRAVIQKGEARQLVYYWFKQRERLVRGEYAVKLYLLWDLVTRQRSDGAMVRLVTPLAAGEPAAAADARMEAFAAELLPRLSAFVPG
jgi:exosortase D (VPLPA-CTERM-specific)